MKMPLVRTLAFACMTALFVLNAGCDRQATVRGTGDTAVTLKTPRSVTLERGGTAQITISISRENVTEPIQVRFANLPQGVRIVDADRQIVGDEATYTLMADESAALVKDHHADVTAEGPQNIAVTETLVITVEDRAGGPERSAGLDDRNDQGF